MTASLGELPPLPRAKFVPSPEPYGHLLSRLSARSVTKHFDAYADIDWDHPDHRIVPDDPRFELTPLDPLEQTEWYRALPQSARARLGLHMTVSRMRTGIQFESVLSGGLLEFALTRPNGSPEFRYAMHEIIEEGQHSLMFQEFVNRTGLDPAGMTGIELGLARRVPAFGRTFPERFFLHVLSGEAPIDYVQRTTLSSRHLAHPLLSHIMRLHVTEEARHICFASRYLTENVPSLGPARRTVLAVAAPFIVGGTMMQMMRIPADVVRAHAIPRGVVREVHRGAGYREQVVRCLRPVTQLCVKLGLMGSATGWIWKSLGLVSAPGVAS